MRVERDQRIKKKKILYAVIYGENRRKRFIVIYKKLLMVYKRRFAGMTVTVGRNKHVV